MTSYGLCCTESIDSDDDDNKGPMPTFHFRKSVLKYFNPLSLRIVTITLPEYSPLNSFSAAATFAPEEMPAKMPSSRATARTVSIAS